MVFGGGRQERELTLLYSSSLNGNLDGCDCKSQPRAGLVKRAAYLRTLGNRDNTFLVDTGDILDALPDPELAEEVLEVYRELGYDAVAVGDQEFSNGVEKILEYREKYPLLSHNLAVCPDENRCIFFSTEALILDRAGIRIGVVGLIDPEVFTLYPENLKEKLKITPPRVTAENMVEILRQEGVQLNVLLYHGHYEAAEALAQEVDGIHIIIVGHEQRLIEPRKVGDTVLVSPGAEGNILGHLTLTFEQGRLSEYRNVFKSFEYLKDPDDPAVRQRIEDYTKKLKERLKKQ